MWSRVCLQTLNSYSVETLKDFRLLDGGGRSFSHGGGCASKREGGWLRDQVRVDVGMRCRRDERFVWLCKLRRWRKEVRWEVLRRRWEESYGMTTVVRAG
ncbi:unnamed protein product [Linum trigynum]|uniref:Uncharacterized protein n=1 Tax=Linum trigynum TaxID=586398 RepID=A0AAV2CEH6_9ROSI